jgi:D-3-phosphoglycerate dehydrogenase
LEQTVNIVNARLVAEQRGIHVEERKTSESLDYVSLLTAQVESDGQMHTVSGTLFGRSSDPRIVFIDDYRLDVIPTGRVLLTWHYDRPGFIGRVGTLLGNNKINIAGMQVGREHPGGKGIMALSVDHPVPPHLVAQIDTFPDALYSVLVDFGAD